MESSPLRCRNRHCPKCQTNARDQWLAARNTELLPVPYVHVVFTLPHQLAPLVFHNKRDLRSAVSRQFRDLTDGGCDHKHLGADIGFLSVLHTWGQNLLHHPHVHCVIPSGGLSPDQQRWVHPRPRFFLPVRVLSRVFRGKFVDGLRELHAAGKLGFHGGLVGLAAPAAFAAMLRGLFRFDWVVYAKRPFGGAEHALHYLGCYTHRVAISNHRLVALEKGEVVFRWRDSAHKNKKRLMRLDLNEFLRRFFLHVLPRGFVRIRHFGFFAHRRRAALLPLCFTLLGQTGDSSTVTDSTSTDAPRPLWLCPQCGGAMAMLSGSPPLRRASALLQGKANDHDLLFVISNLSRAGAPAREDCLHPVPSPRHASQNSPTAPLCPPNADSSVYVVVSRP